MSLVAALFLGIFLGAFIMCLLFLASKDPVDEIYFIGKKESRS
jgi:hypothetical protein